MYRPGVGVLRMNIRFIQAAFNDDIYGYPLGSLLKGAFIGRGRKPNGSQISASSVEEILFCIIILALNLASTITP